MRVFPDALPESDPRAAERKHGPSQARVGSQNSELLGTASKEGSEEKRAPRPFALFAKGRGQRTITLQCRPCGTRSISPCSPALPCRAFAWRAFGTGAPALCASCVDKTYCGI